MSKQQTTFDEVISARWLIPIRPAGKILENISIGIKDGCIAKIAPSLEPPEDWAYQKHTVLDKHVLLPGLVNAHTHAAMNLFKGYADDLPLMTWLEQHIWPAEGQWIDSEFVRDGAELAMAEMIRAGITCFNDMYFFPESTAEVCRRSGLRAQINFPVIDFPSAWARDADDYISKGLSLHDQYRSFDRINIGFGPHAPYTVSDSAFERIAMLSDETQAYIHVHLHETAFEVSSSIEAHGVRPIERLQNLGAITPQTQCVHMTQINDDDLAILKSTGAKVVHCPESNLKLASGLCPVQRLLDEDITVALGTDGAASNNDLDLLGEAKTAALIGKIVSDDAAAMNAQTVLEMATLGGAKAMGLEKDIGSIETGKKADLVAIKLDSIETTPNFNAFASLIYTSVSHNIDYVWVEGKCLLERRQLTTLDTEKILNSSRNWQIKLKKPT